MSDPIRDELAATKAQLEKAEACIREHERFLGNPHLPLDTMMFPLFVLAAVGQHKELIKRTVQLAKERDARPAISPEDADAWARHEDCAWSNADERDVLADGRTRVEYALRDHAGKAGR